MNLRGKFTTDAEGAISFRTIKPAGYPIPTAGVVGRLLAAQQRHPYRPAHLHVLIFKPGFKTLVSQIYVNDDPVLDNDAQFGVTRKLDRQLCPAMSRALRRRQMSQANIIRSTIISCWNPARRSCRGRRSGSASGSPLSPRSSPWWARQHDPRPHQQSSWR